MIQRIQTVWLLLAAICMGLAAKFKFAAGLQAATNLTTAPALKDVTALTHLSTIILSGAFILLTLFNIFQYKKASLQIKIAWLSILLSIATIYFLYWQSKGLTNVTYAITAILPIFALGFTISGLTGIMKDKKKLEELNSNRLR